VPYAIAGITIMLQGLAGLYWLVPAMLFSFIKAIVDSWVLLVEIDR
jgi:modulator of FtsH protease